MQPTTKFRPVFLKKVVSHFSKNLWPRICKKSQKSGNLRKKIFRLKQPKLPLYSFETPFVQSTTNFRPVFLKKVVIHFSRNLWPRICRKSRKIGTVEKFFISSKLPETPKHLLATPFVQPRINFRPVSLKKKVVIFQEICFPGMQ